MSNGADYDVYISKFGYLTGTPTVFVQYGANVEDFYLDSAPSGVVSGTVTETGTGMPLEATVKIFRADNKFGIALFRTYFIIHSRKFLARWSLAMVSRERDQGRRLGSILWDLFAGEAPYRSIFLRAFHPALLIRAAGA